MKTKLPCPATLPLSVVAAFALRAIASLSAAPLTVTTAVHTRPDATSPAISFLKAGTEPVAAPDAPPNLPAGWIAIELPGPFEAYVENKDLNKGLDVKPGVSMRVAPKADAGVLAIAEKDDKTTITGLRGKWTQITLEKKLLGYVNAGGAPAVPPTATASAAASPAPMSPAPVAPGAHGVAVAGHAAPMVDRGDGGGSALPRQFAGRFVSTRRPLTPRRPYDYALNDEAGKRYAYVDISKLLLTEQIEKYIDHNVVVFGAAKNVPEGKDIVIVVETLQLR
ncbi:MAG: hypothetical protein ACREH8_02415 [Opitutaceae bacterium]